MDTTRAAAFHGGGWRPRLGTHEQDVRAGELWRPAGLDCEWAPLRTVLLAVPPVDWPEPEDWNAALYLRPVDFAELRRQLDGYARILTDLGIQVLADDLPELGPEPMYNGIFVRDQFLMTPQGAVVARMGSMPRAAEARWVSAALGGHGVPILHTVRGDGCFEGADALWLRPDLVAVGTGNRTNDAGAIQVAAVLREQGVETRTFRLPPQVQHLLGLLQVVAPDLAVVRSELAPEPLVATLAEVGIDVVAVPESEAVRDGQAINFVTVSPRRVVVVDGWPEIRTWLTGHGIEIAASVHCPELVKCAGGLACATGIVQRDVTEEGMRP